MERQVALVLAVLCALLGCACTAPEDQNNSTVCALPRVVGDCKAAFPRFGFDSATGACGPFTYGGCGGNQNNFKSLEDCEAACPGTGDPGESPPAKTIRRAPPPQTGEAPPPWTGEAPPPWTDLSKSASEETPEPKDLSQDEYTELCTAPLVVGPCRAAFPRWFFNVSSGRCERFTYGGCRGNRNNHQSEEQCTSSCARRVQVEPSKKQIPAEDQGACAVAPDSGPCRAAFSMFYFDPESQSCRTFIYGGCRGNENRYGSERECLDRCVSGASFGNSGKSHNRWTAAFFLFLALAAISFLLLTALIFITLRRNRTPRRALSIRSDKQELLSDSERSSVDSLPLPESPVTP